MSSSEGRWIPIESPTGIEAFGIKEMTVTEVRCSACGSEEDVSFTGYEYCPRCGAKMEGRTPSMGEKDQELTALEKRLQQIVRDKETEVSNLLDALKNEKEVNKQLSLRLDMCREIYRDVFTVIIKAFYLHRNE
jgi:uncharacterized Zn finger protein (UPF0148 family)